MFKTLKSKWLTVVLILLLGWLGLSFIKIKLHDDIVNKEISELDSKVSELKRSNGILEKFVSYMSDPAYLERQARIKLNYKAPGEEVAFFYADDSGTATSSYDISQELKKAPNIVKWWYYLTE